MAAEKNNGGQTEKIAERAVWTAPDSSATVTYSLPLFHEIDFAVNEGYRKISHGGVEVGGLLFGALEENGPRIDAFRPIACDHASGPSFVLSDADLERLVVQLDAAASEPELSALKPVGWFLSRTRSPLQLGERELVLFDRFFPEPRMLTMLVKPERFQPTRFTFLVRDREGKIAPGAGPQPIILPLPGRPASSTDQPVPAIPAPVVNSPAAQPAAPPIPLESEAEPRVEAPPLPDFLLVPKPEASIGKAPEEIAETPPEIPAQKLWEKLDLGQVPLGFEANASAAASPAKPEEAPEPEPERLSQLAVAPSSAALVSAKKPSRREQQSSLRKSAPAPMPPPEVPDPYEQLNLPARKKPPSTGSRLFLVLPLAALLGCAVGYWGYLQLPSPIIPLKVRGLSRSVLVSWPPEDTRNAMYAAIRVNDATPVLLSTEEKTAGQVELSASPDIKVELIARNWMRDSRGIVRFVRAENAPKRSTIP
jgi:hypothetical protein